MRKPPTGEPCAGEPHARFGGRGGRKPFPTPITRGGQRNHVQEMEALMKQRLLVAGLVASMGLAPWAYTAEPSKYSAPRFPSYTKSPKSIEEVMPFARSIARQATGFRGAGFAILKEGKRVALVLTATAEDRA